VVQLPDAGDLVAEGIDAAVRFGPQPASSMSSRLLLETRVLTVASPVYIKKYGRPTMPGKLVGHDCIQYIDPQQGKPYRWEFHRGKASLIATTSYQTGVALCLVGAVAYAGLPFIARKAKRVSSFALSWWQSAVGVLLTAWWPLWHGLPQTTSAWLWLAGLGSIHSGIAYVVLYAGMSQLRTNRVALLQFVYPLTAIVVDRVVYGRQLTALQTVGVLIMAGALWTVRRDS
jgi:DNA-binding transcriptional LysR family regulator